MNLHEKESEYLRKEIEFYLEKIDSMSNILYVSFTVVLTWAIERQNPMICYAAYCIIIPFYVIANSYNISILRIGSYFIVFYDDYQWERRLNRVNVISKSEINRFASSYKLSYIFIGILSTFLSWIILLFNDTILVDDVFVVSNILFTIFTVSFLVIVLMQKSNDQIKEAYIRGWQKVKDEETSVSFTNSLR